jgi:NAD(P)-dependent dehydrogenase (short-subunit alcohol dehydrogenase family)
MAATPSAPGRNTIRVDGDVAVVTGAGGGLGRAFALELASRGAAVLVNDYGGDTSGQPGSAQRSESVAAEIRALGGTALADSTAVGTAEAAAAIISRAERELGKVDILINNAGTSLPGRITDPTDAELERHFRINLFGPLTMMRAAWAPMRKRRYGRILNITSNAVLGFGGNTAYASSKAGVLGLTLDAAREGKPHGILVNGIMPVAYSRLIEQIPDASIVAWFRKHMDPRKVATAAAYFLSRECQLAGQLFSVGGGRLARVSIAESAGIVDAALDAEMVAARLPEALAVGKLEVLEGTNSELALYTRVFPFDSDDGQLALGRE